MHDKENDKRIETYKPVISIHMAKSWDNRTLSKKKWKEVIKHFIKEGYRIICLGAGADFSYEGKGVKIKRYNLTVRVASIELDSGETIEVSLDKISRIL